MFKLTLEEVKEMPVIHQSHFDNLIYETESVRIWHSRCTKADGMKYDNEITVEICFNGKWEIVQQYEAK